MEIGKGIAYRRKSPDNPTLLGSYPVRYTRRPEGDLRGEGRGIRHTFYANTASGPALYPPKEEHQERRKERKKLEKRKKKKKSAQPIRVELRRPVDVIHCHQDCLSDLVYPI